MVVYTLEQCWEILREFDLQKMPILAKEIIFSNKAHFDLGGYVNNQNCRMWGTENLNAYRAMSNQFLFTKIEEDDICNIWFQQDGATCDTVEATLDILRPVFED